MNLLIHELGNPLGRLVLFSKWPLFRVARKSMFLLVKNIVTNQYFGNRCTYHILSYLIILISAGSYPHDLPMFGLRPTTIWVCLKMLCTPKQALNPMVNDHYPYEKWLFHWEYTQHFLGRLTQHFHPKPFFWKIWKYSSAPIVGKYSSSPSCRVPAGSPAPFFVVQNSSG